MSDQEQPQAPEAPEQGVGPPLGRVIKLSWSLFEPKTRRKIVISAVLSAALAAMDAIAVGLVPRLIHRFEADSGGGLGGESVTALAVAIVVFLTAKSIGSGLVMFWQSSFFATDEGERSIELFRHILSMPYLETSQRSTSGFIRDLYVSVPMLYRSAGGGLGVLIADGLGLLGLVVVIFINSPLTALVLGVVVVLAAILYGALIRSPTSSLAMRQQVQANDFLRELGESFGGLKTLKAFSAEPVAVQRFTAVRRLFSKTARDILIYSQVARYYLEIVLVVGLAACLGVIALVQDRGAVLTSFGLLSGVAARAMPALARALTAMTLIKVSGQAVVELESDLRHIDPAQPVTPTALPAAARPSPVPEPGGPVGADAGAPLIRLHEVSFRYPTRPHNALDSVSVDLRPGELVAVRGESGAGKTTLVDVLIGLIAPSSGRVDLSTEGSVGYVAQETFVWDDTVRFNVALDRPSPGSDDDAEVWASLEAAQLAPWVRSLPEGLETRLGERGNRMSGGERQRLGVARAMYGGPSVLLLDEPTSALDGPTARSLMSTLTDIKTAVGVMVVTHDPVVAEYADRTVTIDAVPGRRQTV